MELIPAIDVLGGRVVRLVQGDFDRQTVFGDDPVTVARHWVAQGATRLHLVDLDGARDGRPVQRSTIERVTAETGVACQVAGGIRDADAVVGYIAARADRVVLGTALLSDPDLAASLVDAHGVDRIVAALDVVDGRAVGEGWRHGGVSLPIDDAIGSLLSGGIRRFAVTAIARDGLLRGPDLSLLAEVRRAAPDAAIIASGGISTVDDLRALADLGMEAAILGRALYQGTLTLEAALAAT